MDDIEDLALDPSPPRGGISTAGEGVSVALHSNCSSTDGDGLLVQRKGKRRNNTPSAEDRKNSHDVPGTHTVHVRTWGCSHNNSDGEYMAGQLKDYGYAVTDRPEDADVWVLNSCTVKNPSEDHFITAIRKGKEGGKRVVVAGCVPQAQRKHKELAELSMIGVQQIDRVVEVVEETLKGNIVRLMGAKRANGRRQGGAPLALPKIRRNPLVEIVPINTGCLNQCTYCKTVWARGKLASYPVDEVVERVKSVIQEGVAEIWMSSEDTGAYGLDIGTSIADLLPKVADALPDGTMLRVGMTNPPYILDHLEAVAEVLNHPRVYAFLHVPVQAASDHVLEDMKRKYSVAEFRRVVDYLREHVPGVTIATDIICGFPTETAEDFEETLALVDEYKFPVVNISQMYPRPGTPAARMKRVPTQEVKRRSRAMTKLFNSYRVYDHLMGTRHHVLVTEKASDGVRLVAHNKQYHQILVDDTVGGAENQAESLMGCSFDVVVTRVEKFYMMGEVVDGTVKRREVCVQLYDITKTDKTERDRRTSDLVRRRKLERETEKRVAEEAEEDEKRRGGDERDGEGRGRVPVRVWWTLFRWLRRVVIVVLGLWIMFSFLVTGVEM